MGVNTIKYYGVILPLLMSLCPNSALAASPVEKMAHSSSSRSIVNVRPGHAVVQLGTFWSTQGQAQDVNIQYLIGNQYTVFKARQWNGLAGLGYFLDGLDKERLHLSYGLNGFYLAPTSVSGTIIQEHLFTNLSYGYKIQHVPLYLAGKAVANTMSDRLKATFDVGIGPNFMHIGSYNETPLTDYSLPDYAYTSRSKVNFSATAGIGLRLLDVFGKAPLECGYRFFYLGQSQLVINNDQFTNPLKTGNVYANAIVCSFAV